MRVVRNGKTSWVADCAIVMDGFGKLVRKFYQVLSTNFRRLLNRNAYREDMVRDRPLLRRVFDNCYRIDCLVPQSLRNEDFFEWLRNDLKEIKAKGWKPVILINFAGGKMGGKKYPCFFIGKTNPIHDWAKEVGIYENLMALTPAKRFEREKKLLGRWERFRIKPKVRIIDNIPGFNGVAFADPEWMKECEIEAGCKMSGPAKDVIHPIPPFFNFGDADLIIQKGGNKLSLSAEKFGELAGYDPELTAERRFSENLETTTKDGNTFIGRNPGFGLDLMADIGIEPSIDLTETNRILNWDFDEDLKKKFFMFLDGDGNLRLNRLGRDIFENGQTLTNPEIKGEVYTLVSRDIRRKLNRKVKGWFGTAAPMRLCPFPDLARWTVIVGYSGGLIAKAKVAIFNNLIYVDEETWAAMGRDYDGDLVFVFSFGYFPDKNVISDAVRIRQNYVLPEKPDEKDERDDIDTMIDILVQSRLCGTAYNNGKVFVDACRYAGLPTRTVIDLEIRAMAIVEEFIFSFKRRVISKEAPTPEELADRFGVPQVKPYIESAEKFFRALRSRGLVRIDDKLYHPLEVLKMRAMEASSKALGWNERVVARFKNLGVKSPEIKRNELEEALVPTE